MTTTWTIQDGKLQRLLKDEAGTKFSEALREDGYNAALETFAAHTATASATTITGDGSTTAWSLPDNIIETDDSIEGVWDQTDKEWLEPVRFVPGDQWTDSTPTSSSAPKGWYIWPEDTLNTTQVHASGDILKLYYYAYWNGVADGVDPIDVPRWALQALLYYAAAYCLAPGAISAANIRQYDTKADSGHPEHNPIFQQAKWFMQKYQEVLNRHPAQQRGIGFTPGRGL